MNSTDDTLRDAFSNDAAGPGDGVEAIGQSIMESFRGRRRWLNILTWVKMAALVVMAILSVYGFIRSGETKWQVAFASLFVSGILGCTMLMILYWVELSHGATMRELKRLELVVARLAADRDRSGPRG